MTDCFFLNDNKKSVNFNNSQTVHDNRYSNLNLNQNLKCSDESPVHFNSKLYNNKHFVSDNDERRENPSYLYKPSKISDFSNCNEIEESKKPWKKNISLNTTNDSTLSLHIAAYENSVETDSFNGCKNKDWQKGKSDSIKNEKQIFTAAKFVFLNPFEFPRQQNDEIPKPELSHFKAFQQLLNSNKSDANTESAKVMERKKTRRSVYRLPNFTAAQRAAYYGLPYIPSNDDEEDDKGIGADSVENQSESSLPSYTISESLINAFIPPGKTPKPDDDNDLTITGENVQVQTQENQTQNESSLPSYTISESLINAFTCPGKTPTINEDDENVETIVADDGEYQNRKSQSSVGSWTISQSALDAFIPPGKTPKPDDDNDLTIAGENVQVQTQENHSQNESSLPSYTISESLINAFIPPGKTPKPDDNNDRTISGENVQVQAQENHTQNESSLPSYTISQSALDAFVPPGKTPKATDAGDDDVEMMEVDGEEDQKSFVSNQHKPLSEPITTSSQPPFDFRAPQTQPLNTDRVMTSRLSLLLPRFMQPTTSSSARTSKKPVSCSSPLCSKRTNPPPIMAQEARAPATTSRSLQKPHLTPRKSVAVCRKVLDQSLNAAKLPVIDVSQFKEFQPTEKSRPTRSSGGKRIHPLTPQQTKPTSKFGVSNKVNLNRTKAFDLLQQYQSPVTPRVAAKRITPNPELPGPLQFNELQPVETSRLHHHTSGGSNDPESQIDQDFGKLTFAEEKESSGSHSDESVKIITPRSSSNVLEILQTPTSSKNTTSSRRTIPESPIDHDFENAEPSTSLHRRGGSYILDSPIDHDFDFANPSPSFNSSVFSINTPGPSRSAFPKRNPLIPVNFRNESNMTINDSTRSNESVIKITAAQKKNDKKVKYVLAKPKLVKPHSPEIDEQNLRRSQRTRVRRLRSFLNENPIYDIGEDGLATLVDTTTVEVKNPRAEKYLTVSPGEQIVREKALKERQKSRQQFAKVQRERENDL